MRIRVMEEETSENACSNLISLMNDAAAEGLFVHESGDPQLWTKHR